MVETLLSTVHLLLTVVGLLGAPDAGTLLVAAAVSLALALIAAVVVFGRGLSERAGAHPRRAIDVSAPLAQSDPDAAGHPRPRAPQSAASAA